MSGVRTTAVYVVLFAALFFLQYHLWFEKGGIVEIVRLKKMLSAQSRQNEQLRKDNDELAFQVQKIQNSQDAAESRARSELGMVKKGETFYQVVK